MSDIWQPRPDPTCPNCRGYGIDADEDGRFPCGCKHSIDAEAISQVEGEAYETLVTGFGTLFSEAEASERASRIVAALREDGELDDRLAERVELLELEAAEKARQRRLAARAEELRTRERRHVQQMTLRGEVE